MIQLPDGARRDLAVTGSAVCPRTHRNDINLDNPFGPVSEDLLEVASTP